MNTLARLNKHKKILYMDTDCTGVIRNLANYTCITSFLTVSTDDHQINNWKCWTTKSILFCTPTLNFVVHGAYHGAIKQIYSSMCILMSPACLRPHLQGQLLCETLCPAQPPRLSTRDYTSHFSACNTQGRTTVPMYTKCSIKSNML